MIPAAYLRIPALPQNANGKVDRKALPPIPSAAQRACQTATGPLTPTEHHLLDRVRAVLDNQDIGIDDDFFQLGGNSLTAARLIAVLRRDYGPDLALTTVFANPDLRRLAAELDHASGADPLAPVLDLRKADAAAPTVFCLHPILGIGWGYAALAQALPRRVGICALQSSALTEPDTWPDMRTMARDYVARIRAIQPHGPYYLVGWSFGGLLAHEIASQLQAQGAQIACLCLLDAYPFQSRMDANTEASRVQQALAFLGAPPDPALHTLDALAEKLVTRPEISALRTTIGKDRFDRLRGRIRDMVEANLDLAQRHLRRRSTRRSLTSVQPGANRPRLTPYWNGAARRGIAIRRPEPDGSRSIAGMMICWDHKAWPPLPPSCKPPFISTLRPPSHRRRTRPGFKRRSSKNNAPSARSH
ncbi:alpha/beta fold hydrolase [Sulfitobacter porphyrae]|uniref:Alpha/beta fold hydrolase n=1 Tax=Sulfitobacter porphyrae TaxID=1246864 RepID=A0ABW2B8W2_9RHOB